MTGPVFAVMTSSASDDWATDPAFVAAQARAFGPFTLDPCATHQNHKAAAYFTVAEDGLDQPWAPHRVWMNPPYGRTIGRWMRKALEESRKGALIVCLVPARTDTRWWRETALAAHEIAFVGGRLRFGDQKYPAPFPSAVIVFRPSARVTRQPIIRNACAACGWPVWATRSDATFCSSACRQRAYRRRREHESST